jgi:queuine/archaeosine tRNA-ribosyltransferase
MILEIRSAINRDEFSSYKKNFLAEFHSKEN